MRTHDSRKGASSSFLERFQGKKSTITKQGLLHLFDQRLRKSPSPPPHPLRLPNSQRPKIASDSLVKEHRVELGVYSPLSGDLVRESSGGEGRRAEVEPTSRMSHRTEVVRRGGALGSRNTQDLVLPRIKDRLSNSMNRLGRVSGAGGGGRGGYMGGYMGGRKMDENAVEHFEFLSRLEQRLGGRGH